MTISDPTGNGNGRLDPGETADIIVTSANDGSSTSPNALATLGTSSSYVVINTNSAEPGAIAPGQIVTAVFNITVDTAAPVGALVDLNYSIVAGQYSAGKTFNAKVGLILEDFESGGFAQFPWTMGGNQPWTVTNVDPYEGVYSAKSGTISNGQKSDLILQMEVTAADSISFYVKTSSESGYDYLKFFLDGASIGQWSGETAWTRAAFPVSAGNHTFKFEYMKDGSASSGSDCAWIDYILFPTAAPSQASVTGAVTYANTANTPLGGLTINLKNSGGGTVGTTTTNATGNYTFASVPAGNYTLEVLTTKPWGGVAATDVLLYRKHIASIALLEGIYLTSGDVNASGTLTASDVLLVKKRIAAIITSFPVGDWYFNNAPITVGSGSVTQNFKGITYGDANGSYIPADTKSLGPDPQGTIMLGTVAAVQGPVTVPVVISDMPDLGSFQFTVQYDPSKLALGEITDWYSGINDVTVGYPVPGLITFVWAADLSGITVRDGVLCNLHFSATAGEGSAIKFVSAPTVQEFSDYNGVLFEPQTINGGVKSTTGTGENGLTGISIYPNPSNGKFTLRLGSVDGLVNIRVMDAVGAVVYEEANVRMMTGQSKSIDLSAQPKGIYMIRVESPNQVMTQKLVIGR
jgi:hypothetical protein